MIQGRGGLSFPLESLQGMKVFGQLLGKKLQGHQTVQFGVFRLAYDTHPAATQLLDDPVMGNRFADHDASQRNARRRRH